jgi:hypothetical protein
MLICRIIAKGRCIQMQPYNKRLAEQRQRQNGINWIIKKSEQNKQRNILHFRMQTVPHNRFAEQRQNQNGVANNERHLQVAEQKACRTTATPKNENGCIRQQKEKETHGFA